MKFRFSKDDKNYHVQRVDLGIAIIAGGEFLVATVFSAGILIFMAGDNESLIKVTIIFGCLSIISMLYVPISEYINAKRGHPISKKLTREQFDSILDTKKE